MTAHRVILLGASNLTLSFPMLFESLRRHGPSQIMAVHGHGRSYGMWSRVLFRALPPITACRLWDDLQRQLPAAERTVALLTDVGNDLLYGAEVPQILNWVSECLDRLRDHQAQILLTTLPVRRITRLAQWQYLLARSCLFPTSSVKYSDMLARMQELNDALCELGNQYCAELIEPHEDWYGIDPIHVARASRVRAWQHILSSWSFNGQPLQIRRASPAQAVRLWTLRPAERQLGVCKQERAQPVLSVGQGCRLWLY